jgi:hypothetical protein
MEITYPMKGKYVISNSPREVCFVVTFTIAQDDVSSESRTQEGFRASSPNSGEGLASKDVPGILDYY